MKGANLKNRGKRRPLHRIRNLFYFEEQKETREKGGGGSRVFFSPFRSRISFALCGFEWSSVVYRCRLLSAAIYWHLLPSSCVYRFLWVLDPSASSLTMGENWRKS